MRVKGQQFIEDDIRLDGIEFDNCLFTRCKIIYKGERITSLTNNYFSDCEFVFEDSARLTMGFVVGLARSSDGFLVSLLKSLSLDANRLERLSNLTPTTSSVNAH